MKNIVFLLLGTNLGDRAANLKNAKDQIEADIGQIIKSSSLYSTAPWGVANQPDFYNQVIQVSTLLDPFAVLRSSLLIEEKMGRIRKSKWGPRLIDIDLLFYGNEVIDSTELMLPHPGIQSRNFTLQPLVEIAPNYIHPLLNKSLTELLIACEDKSLVQKIELQT
jgi:2-amino-4-hydroxy-6-hydroxymethyldihydropteridine diphosphokinase